MSYVFTENKTYVSEFYTDCLAISTSLPLPQNNVAQEMAYQRHFYLKWSQKYKSGIKKE